MIFWTIANIVSAVTTTWVVVYMLTRHRGSIAFIDQTLMGVVAGMMFLRIGPVLGKAMETTTPFDDWATSLMQIALTTLFIRQAWRMEKRETEA